jgi:hypothetical protein
MRMCGHLKLANPETEARTNGCEEREKIGDK